MNVRRGLGGLIAMALAGSLLGGCATCGRYQDQVNALQRELRERDSLIAKKEAIIKEQNDAIDRKERDMGQLAERYRELKDHADRRDQDIRSQEKVIEGLRQEIDRCREKLSTAARQETEIYVTREGDWLSKIAQQKYNDMRLWPLIWHPNKDVIMADTGRDDPNLIWVNQRLRIYYGFTDAERNDAIEEHKARFGRR